MAFLGAVVYFFISPRQFNIVVIEAKLFALLILTVFIPIVFLFMLNKLKLLEDLDFKNTKAKRLYLIGIVLLLISVNNFIIDPVTPELYYYYTGLVLALSCSFFCALFKLNISLHSLHLSALLGFVLGISLLYSLQIQWLIALIVFAIGWSVTERIATKKHNTQEVLLAIAFGVVPQIVFFGTALIRYKM